MDIPEMLAAIHLSVGKHDNPDEGMCLLEAVAFMRGLPHTDHPPCVSPLLGQFGRSLNDTLPDDTRQLLVPLIPLLPGTAGDGFDEQRGYMVLDWIIRTWLPACLDLVPSCAEDAAALRSLGQVMDIASAERAGPVIRESHKNAVDARDVAGDVAWAAARDAARAAAGDAWAAARAAAKDAAGDAWDAAKDAAGDAWAAARDVAEVAVWDAAEAAAKDAAGDAWAAAGDVAWVAAGDAWAAAWDAAEAAAEAAEAAAEIAAGDAWAAAATQLQLSAIELYANMARLGKGGD